MNLDEKSIVIRSACGRIGDEVVMYELRIGHPNPTAAMLRKAEAAINLLVQWAEGDEAAARASPEPEPEPAAEDKP